VSENEPVDEPDFYMENGFVVFTESFLRKRGFCCRSGCRHCPYGFSRDTKPETESSNLRNESH